MSYIIQKSHIYDNLKSFPSIKESLPNNIGHAQMIHGRTKTKIIGICSIVVPKKNRQFPPGPDWHLVFIIK